jgi:WD40 repeat protein
MLDDGNGAVWTAAFSRDGSRLAVAGDGDSVRIFRTQAWELERRVSSGPMHVLGFSGDGRRLWGNGEKGTRTWDAATGGELRKADVLPAPGQFTPDGRFFLGRVGAEVRVWDFDSPREPARFAHHTGGVVGIAVHPHGRLFATIGQDRHLKVWGPVTGGMSGVRGKGFLGVTVQDAAGGRVVISTLYEGSAAQTAGLRVGDLLLRVGGQAVEGMTQAVDQIGSFQEGDEIEFEIERGGDVKTVKVRLGKRPPTMP